MMSKPEGDNVEEPDKTTPDAARRKQRRIWLFVICALVVVAGVVTAIVLLTTRDSNDNSDSNSKASNAGSAGSNSTSTSAPSVVSPSMSPAAPGQNETERTTQVPTLAPATAEPTAAPSEAEPTLYPSLVTTSPTEYPTTSPSTASPTSDEELLTFCTNDFLCLGDGEGDADRFGNQRPLRAGRALCSKVERRYSFGLSFEGVLAWMDCENPSATIEFFRPTADAVGVQDFYFLLHTNGTMQILNKDGNVEWERPCLKEMSFWRGCLGNPYYDCPYLHLHRDGVCVLNWIDGGWQTNNIKRLYDF